MNMKVIVVLAAFVVAGVLADIPWVDPAAKDTHYSSHHDSVAEARKAVSARLQALNSNSGNSDASSFDNQGTYSGFAEPCTISCGTGGAASSSSHVSSDVEQIDQQQNTGFGLGYVGFNGHKDANSEFSSQSEFSQTSHTDNGAATATIVLPPTGSHSSQYSSSASEHAVSHASQPAVAVVPIVSTGNGAESERYYSERLAESSSAAQPVVNTVVYTGAGNNAESQHYLSEHSSTTANVASPIVHYPGPSGSSRYVNRNQQQRYIEERPTTNIVQVPVYGNAASTSSNYATNHVSSETLNASPVVTVPIVSYPAGGNSERVYERSERITTERKQPTTTTTYIYTPVVPATNSESHVSRSERLSTQRATPVVAPIVYQPAPRPYQRYVSHGEQYRTAYEQPAVQPLYTSVYPSGASSNRYLSRSESERIQSAAAVQPIITVGAAVPSGSSAHSERFESESSHSSNAHSAPTYVSYVPSTGSSFARSQNYAANSAHNSGAGLLHVPYVDPSLGAGSSFDSSSSSLHSSKFGLRPSARIGSSVFSDNYRSTDLSSVISESERLAREQARRGAARGSSQIDADFGRSSSLTAGSAFDDNVLGLGLNAGNGAFVRTKQWENNEKWSSDTKYDESGRPRTYSRLSTAESELHNVNGQKTGFKAATTTLEDDGKVSTYTLHT